MQDKNYPKFSHFDSSRLFLCAVLHILYLDKELDYIVYIVLSVFENY